MFALRYNNWGFIIYSLYSRDSIIRNCGDYFNKPESPEVRMKFALQLIWACKNRFFSHDVSDMSTESNENEKLV